MPSLNPHDPCNDIAAPFVPANVTRQDDIARFGFDGIGLAPWVSSNCTLSFLDASRQAGTTALVFFQPSNNSIEPPPADNHTWALGNAGSGWREQNKYPVYAIPGTAGAALMHQLSWYSAKSPNASITINPQQKGDVRLFAILDLCEYRHVIPVRVNVSDACSARWTISQSLGVHPGHSGQYPGSQHHPSHLLSVPAETTASGSSKTH